MNKITTLTEAVKQIKDESNIAIGGNCLHRSPMAIVREIARQRKKDLGLIKTAGAMDIDLLCFAGCVAVVDAGFISYETKYGLASHYRKAVQEGNVLANEHACYTVISALRASVIGAPFMPVAGLIYSELIEQNDYFTEVNDPFTGNKVTLVSVITPDYAILHVHEADEKGNCVINPPIYEDVLIAKASKNIIVSAEKIVSTEELRKKNQCVNIPHFLVSAVVPLEKGAFPCSCYPNYDISDQDIINFLSLKEKDELFSYLDELKTADHAERGI